MVKRICLTSSAHSEDGGELSPQRERRRVVLAAASATAVTASSVLASACRDSAAGPTGPGSDPPKVAPTPSGVVPVRKPAPSGAYDGVLAVSGQSFVNGAGLVTQLRGADTEGYVAASINDANQGVGGDVSGGDWNFDQPHGGPVLSALKAWKMNAIRIGINEASWLGYTCYTTDGAMVNPDPHGVYRSQIEQQLAALNGIGCYVVLVLGWSNPGRAAPYGQDIMANQDNSIQFWESIARYFGYPNGKGLKRNGGSVDDRSIIFELYNEPELWGDAAQPWKLVMDGGFYRGPYNYNKPYAPIYPYACSAPSGSFKPGEAVTISGGITGKVLCYYVNTTRGYPSSGTGSLHLFDLSAKALAAGSIVTGASSGARTTITSADFGWHVAGHAQLLSAVRAAGAWNVCLLSGVQYAQDLGRWGAYAPTDMTPPAGYNGPGWKPQIGASWHPYPAQSSVSQASVASGGSGYAVGDTILLPMPESGPAANSVYWQAQLKVTSVSAGAVTGVRINSYLGGTPGHATANGGGTHGADYTMGGTYCNLLLPVNPVPQDSSSGTGSGATFNLTFHSFNGNSGTGSWPGYDTWAQVVTLKNTFNGIGVPICITETGEHSGTGVSGSPWMAAQTAWCDDNGVSLICFCYNPSPGWYNAEGWDLQLVTVDHQPTPGYGEFMYNWFTTHA